MMGNLCGHYNRPVNDDKPDNRRRSAVTEVYTPTRPKSPTLRENMVHKTQHRNVFQYYRIVKKLGEGSMGSVSAVKKCDYNKGLSSESLDNSNTSVLSDKTYALKSIILSRVSINFMEELRNEITILQSLDHPNIVKAYEVYESKVNIYLVLENCGGGDLYSRGPYSEKAAAKIVGKLLSAIVHMHEHGCTHRDLKYENVMFESKEMDAEIKLIDFGLSKKSKPGKSKYMTAGVGTIYTMAPEIFSGKYTSQVDLWSIGVMTFMLLSSTKPFREKSRSKTKEKILAGNFSFRAEVWENISQESKELVKSLIVLSPTERLTGEQALKHKWLSEEFPLSERIPDDKVMKDIRQSLVDYGDVGLLKKMALMVIAHKSSSDEIVELRKAFDAYDTANNGVISLTEFKAAMNKNNDTGFEDIDNVFDTLDTGKDGQIYYTEFLAATLEAQGRIVEETIVDAFDRIDCDDTGYISAQNLREFLGDTLTEQKITQLMAEGDLDGNGRITLEEFLTSFHNTQEEKRIALRYTGYDGYDSDISSSSCDG
mmetsp:Transcript_3490/g.3924  ORF Transcript_3490/g.3924 Transcript_3490/m.3924 type:complete len:540 (+) Transcript_3490:42-1661(+)